MIKLAIDMGSTVTKIYLGGVVLSEPSCVAVSGIDREVKAIGKDAKQLFGKTAELTDIVSPVYEGEIVESRLAAAMLKEFLSRIKIKPGLLSKIEVLISVPSGASQSLVADYAALAEECGLRKVYFVESPYLAALGMGATLSEANPVFCLNIGGGTTNVAALSLGGVIAGLSMNIGGNNMDMNVIRTVEQSKQLRIGMLTAERVKNEIGSLSMYPNMTRTTVAEGSSCITNRPASVSVSAADITPCISVYVDKILEYAGMVLNKLPAEVAANVNKNGIYLSGGVAKVQGINEYVYKMLGMRVCPAEEPQYAVVTGGGILIHNEKLLKKLAIEY